MVKVRGQCTRLTIKPEFSTGAHITTHQATHRGGFFTSMSKHNLYNHQWREYRKTFLANNPLCVECEKLGKITLASVVDHIKKHDGDYQLFWDTDNHQALCAHCHNSYKQTLEKSGYTKGNAIDGTPLDQSHHWNR